MQKHVHSILFFNKKRKKINAYTYFTYLPMFSKKHTKEWKDKPKPKKNGLPKGKRKEQWGGNRHRT